MIQADTILAKIHENLGRFPTPKLVPFSDPKIGVGNDAGGSSFCWFSEPELATVFRTRGEVFGTECAPVFESAGQSRWHKFSNLSGQPFAHPLPPFDYARWLAPQPFASASGADCALARASQYGFSSHDGGAPLMREAARAARTRDSWRPVSGAYDVCCLL